MSELFTSVGYAKDNRIICMTGHSKILLTNVELVIHKYRGNIKLFVDGINCREIDVDCDDVRSLMHVLWKLVSDMDGAELRMDEIIIECDNIVIEVTSMLSNIIMVTYTNYGISIRVDEYPSFLLQLNDVSTDIYVDNIQLAIPFMIDINNRTLTIALKARDGEYIATRLTWRLTLLGAHFIFCVADCEK